MAEQATAGTVQGTGTTGAVAHGGAGHMPHNPGRPIAWAGTTVVIIGFIIGGIAFVPSPHWVLFWVSTGIAVIGLLILLFSKAMNTDWY